VAKIDKALDLVLLTLEFFVGMPDLCRKIAMTVMVLEVDHSGFYFTSFKAIEIIVRIKLR
jgi:hypothetical protein